MEPHAARVMRDSDLQSSIDAHILRSRWLPARGATGYARTAYGSTRRAGAFAAAVPPRVSPIPATYRDSSRSSRPAGVRHQSPAAEPRRSDRMRV